MTMVHATCVAIDGVGVLLQGPSGSGKSDLALRLIDRGALLIADDRVEITVGGGRVLAKPPWATAGQIEARGIGILRVPSAASAAVGLVVDLVPGGPVERMPDPDISFAFGMAVPRLQLDPFEASAPAKLRLAVANLAARELPPAPAEPAK
jgi:hypothetical protein